MVLFIGKRLKLNGLAGVFKNRLQDDDIKFYEEESISIKSQENNILYESENADYIVYDTDPYLDDGRTIAGTIKNIYKTNSAIPIVLVPTDNPRNEIVKECLALQIKNFVNTALSLGEQKDQLEKIIVGYYEANEREDIAQAEEVMADEQNKLSDYVEGLYLASQREDKRENTTIIVKKSFSEVVLSAIREIIRVVFAIVATLLISVALITLINIESRTAFLNVINQIIGEISSYI